MTGKEVPNKRNMLANSEFVALLKQANTDISKMAEVICVSESQLWFVTNTTSGMGIIKDTDLYKLYNTNLHKAKELLEKLIE